jgi:hypothetical protein
MRMTPPEEAADPTADPWAEFIGGTAPEFRKPTIAQIATVTKLIWEALVAGAQYSHERLLEIWDDVRPDVVCTDNVTGYPAVELAGAPWVRFVSANPPEMRDELLPPPLSGLPVSDRSEWRDFVDEYTASTPTCSPSTTRSASRSGSRRAGPTSSTPSHRGRTFTPRSWTTSARRRSARPGTASTPLGPRIYGDQFLPQPLILPQCDLLSRTAATTRCARGSTSGCR